MIKRIDYIQFKNNLENMKNKELLIDIQTMIQTKIIIRKTKMSINKYSLSLFNDEKQKINIDINYVANFYMDEEQKIIKLELDAIGYIMIKQNSE